MTETPSLDVSEEFGQLEAAEIPDEDAEESEYVEDPDYDEINNEIDPETVSEGMGPVGTEPPSEGGDI